MNAIAHPLKIEPIATRPELARDILGILRAARACEKPMRIEYRTEFDRFCEEVHGVPDKDEVSPVFDPAKAHITSDNGFWVRGTNDDGELVHLQAVRYDNLGSSTLADHWAANSTIYRPPGLDPDLDKSRFSEAPVSQEIKGQVCYHGELWIHRDYRGQHLASRLANLAMLIALARFQPDYIYCLLTPEVVRTGLSVRHGYLHLHPHGIRWHVPGRENLYDEYMAWMSGDELSQLMSRSPVVC